MFVPPSKPNTHVFKDIMETKSKQFVKSEADLFFLGALSKAFTFKMNVA